MMEVVWLTFEILSNSMKKPNLQLRSCEVHPHCFHRNEIKRESSSQVLLITCIDSLIIGSVSPSVKALCWSAAFKCVNMMLRRKQQQQWPERSKSSPSVWEGLEGHFQPSEVLEEDFSQVENIWGVSANSLQGQSVQKNPEFPLKLKVMTAQLESVAAAESRSSLMWQHCSVCKAEQTFCNKWDRSGDVCL